MEYLLLGSLLLRVCALVAFVVLFVRHRHAALGVIAFALAMVSAAFAVLYVRRFVDPGFLRGWAWLAPAMDAVSVLVGVGALTSAALVARLFSRNGALLDRAQGDARRQAMLLRELDHRVRNNLAALLTLIDLSWAEEPGSLTAERLRRRIHGIAECHTVLARSEGEPVSMGVLVETLCAANPDVATVACGEEAALPQRLVQPLGMILQELFSNARKHGVAGRGSGPVRVEWRVASGSVGGVFEVEWTEPTVAGASGPFAAGSGLSLVRGLAEFELGGGFTTDRSSGSLVHVVRVPLSPDEGGAQRVGSGSGKKGRRLWAGRVA